MLIKNVKNFNFPPVQPFITLIELFYIDIIV